MKAYCYDENQFYLGEVDCYLDPLETEIQGREIYLLPANATFTTVPEYDPETQYLLWDGAAWGIKDIVVPDPGDTPAQPPSIEERIDAIEDALLILL